MPGLSDEEDAAVAGVERAVVAEVRAGWAEAGGGDEAGEEGVVVVVPDVGEEAEHRGRATTRRHRGQTAAARTRLTGSSGANRRFRQFHRTPPVLGFLRNVGYGKEFARFVPTSTFRPRRADWGGWRATAASRM
nr:unnamed protein product [Digitaria exilis]